MKLFIVCVALITNISFANKACKKELDTMDKFSSKARSNYSQAVRLMNDQMKFLASKNFIEAKAISNKILGKLSESKSYYKTSIQSASKAVSRCKTRSKRASKSRKELNNELKVTTQKDLLIKEMISRI